MGQAELSWHENDLISAPHTHSPHTCPRPLLRAAPASACPPHTPAQDPCCVQRLLQHVLPVEALLCILQDGLKRDTLADMRGQAGQGAATTACLAQQDHVALAVRCAHRGGQGVQGFGGAGAFRGAGV